MIAHSIKSRLVELGLMRQVLLGLALVNLLLPILHWIGSTAAISADRSLWDIFATLIAPVMAPLLLVVVLFDYIMSRVRAADATGVEQTRFAAIARLEFAVIAISVIFWGPYFYFRIL